jgi:glycine hydroxymethyltransferase
MVDNSILLPVSDLDLAESDPEIMNLVNLERQRQIETIELIASENYQSKAIMQSMGTCFCNGYTEGVPPKKSFGRYEFNGAIEYLCMKRALKAFNLDPTEWACNVQPFGGTSANFIAFTALL